MCFLVLITENECCVLPANEIAIKEGIVCDDCHDFRCGGPFEIIEDTDFIVLAFFELIGLEHAIVFSEILNDEGVDGAFDKLFDFVVFEFKREEFIDEMDDVRELVRVERLIDFVLADQHDLEDRFLFLAGEIADFTEQVHALHECENVHVRADNRAADAFFVVVDIGFDIHDALRVENRVHEFDVCHAGHFRGILMREFQNRLPNRFRKHADRLQFTRNCFHLCRR